MVIARDRDRLAVGLSRTVLDLCCMRSCFKVAQFRILFNYRHLKPSLDTEAIRGGWSIGTLYRVSVKPKRWTKFASGFGPGGPDPLADLDRGDQIRGGQIRGDTGTPSKLKNIHKCTSRPGISSQNKPKRHWMEKKNLRTFREYKTRMFIRSS